jgi:hypothetical protein
VTIGGQDAGQIQAQAMARAELTRGERLIWADWAQARRPGLAILPPLLFGIFFAGFAVFWMSAAAFINQAADEAGPMRFFPLFGVPFFIIGLWVACSPIVAWLFPRPTVYALSDRRLIAIAGRRSRSVRAFDLEAIREIQRTERADGSGDIVFSTPATGRILPRGGGWDMAASGFPPDRRPFGRGPFTGMFGVPRVRIVAEQVERARRNVPRDEGAPPV